MPLTSGTRLGAYEVVALIGSGGMGEVYRAKDTRLKREVAIKILPEAFAQDPDRLARFQREAELLATLNHPNIAQIHGIEDRALVLELVDGPTLADRITQGPIPVDEALPIAKQIAEALEAAHERGIIHRDLKPANIKLANDGKVKVLDFGLAKALDAGPAEGPAALSQSPTAMSPAMTQVGVILGTAAYMSPEQARGKPLDRRVDIWAFGCVTYEMLTGHRPFDVGDTVSDAFAAILKSEPDFARLPPGTPSHIRTLLARCLQKDSQKRLPHIGVARLEIDEPLSAALPLRQERGMRSRIPWLIAAASAVVAVIAAVLLLERPPAAPLVTRLDIATPPTNDPFSFALAPDGRQIVYSANSEKGSQLWVRRLDQPQAQALSGTDGGFSPFWSPDGRAIAFFADGKLKRVDFTGAAPQVIADASAGRGGTWHENGDIVFAPTTNGGLVRIAAGGGPATRITPQGSNHRWPQFLPDSRRLLSHAIPAGSTERGTFLISLDDGKQTPLAAADTAVRYAAPGYVLRVSQGILVAQKFDAFTGATSGESIPVAQGVASDYGTSRSAFSVSSTGVLAYRSGVNTRRQLVWVHRTGRVLESLGSPEEDSLANPALSPDGRRVAAQRTRQENIDLWLLDLERGIESRASYGESPEASPVWSPDGSRVVFRSRRGGGQDLYLKSVAGTDEELIAATAQDESPADWSVDGRTLLFTTQNPESASDIWALPMIGDRKPQPLVRSSFDEIQPGFSPDGRWLAYASNESGRYEVYVRALRGDLKWQLSTSGGSSPRWARDGRELFYVAPDNRLMAVPLVTVQASLKPGSPVALFLTRLASGGNIDSRGYLARAQYAVAADGRFLMNVSEGDAASPITIVLNWTAELSK